MNKLIGTIPFVTIICGFLIAYTNQVKVSRSIIISWNLLIFFFFFVKAYNMIIVISVNLREEAAHSLAKLAISQLSDQVWREDNPRCINNIVIVGQGSRIIN